eukprot:366341-Prymnesium_polylepis.1
MGETTPDTLVQIQQVGNYTWPLVKIGRSESWLNWLAGTEQAADTNVGGFGDSIKLRNKTCFSVLHSFFGSDIGSDEPWDDEHFPVGLLGESDDTPENRAEIWRLIEIVIGDICDACPAWAQAYLSVELVDDPKLEEEDAASVASLRESLPDAEREEQFRILRQIELLEVEAESAREVASVVWNGYHTKDNDIRDELDKHGNRACTWAHEQLLRCVTRVRVTGRKPADEYRIGPYIDPVNPKREKRMDNGTVEKDTDGKAIMEDNLVQGLRGVDRSEVRIGYEGTSDYYECWHTEIYLELGVGNVGQLCCLPMMYDYYEAEAVAWYLNAQGRPGKIVRITENPEKGNNLSPFLYRVHVDFFVTHSTAAELQADIRNQVCTKEKRLIVDVPGDMIWPFSFRFPLRYGDQTVLDKEKKSDDAYSALLTEFSGDLALTDYKWFAKQEDLAKRGLLEKSNTNSDAINIKIGIRGYVYFVKWDTKNGGGILKGTSYTAREPQYMYVKELDESNPGRVCRTKEDQKELMLSIKSLYLSRKRQ